MISGIGIRHYANDPGNRGYFMDFSIVDNKQIDLHLLGLACVGGQDGPAEVFEDGSVDCLESWIFDVDGGCSCCRAVLGWVFETLLLLVGIDCL